MLLATIVLLGAVSQSGELGKSVAGVSANTISVGNATKDVAVAADARELPSMPLAKNAGGEAEIGDAAAGVNSSGTVAVAATTAPVKVSANAMEPAVVAVPVQPIKVKFARPRETRGQRVAWYGLMAAGHGAAAFDAYSTRRAISGNFGVESNPLLRPFSHSSALYAVTQVSPAVLDYIGKRMMRSENPGLRKLWWLPQAAGSGFSVFAGVHNMGVVK
jgi:hypothetical protein